jgi:regulator of protease activity HflC (stomatin/prohibitin superfamily)
MKPARLSDPYPLAHRLLLFLCGPFGLRRVSDNWLGIVYRKKKFHSLRGPGFFWIKRSLDEQVEGSISIEWDSFRVSSSDLQTRDNAELEVDVELIYRLDPRSLPYGELKELAKHAVLFSHGKMASRQKVKKAVTAALSISQSKLDAEPVCEGQEAETIERGLEEGLNAYLGKALDLRSVEIVDVKMLSEPTQPKDEPESWLSWSLND